MLVYFQAHKPFSWIPVRADFTTLKRSALPQVVGDVMQFCGQWKELELWQLCLSSRWPFCRSPISSTQNRMLPVRKPWQRSQSPVGIDTAFSNYDSRLLPAASFSHRDYF